MTWLLFWLALAGLALLAVAIIRLSDADDAAEAQANLARLLAEQADDRLSD